MTGEERRTKIYNMLTEAENPINGNDLAKMFDVSRQIIVQDIALLRADGKNVFSTRKGYLIQEESRFKRVFKVKHGSDMVERELQIFVDYGCLVEDVFIYHDIYGKVCAELNLSSRFEIKKYLEKMTEKNANLLTSITDGYHYHTVTAEDESVFKMVQDEMAKQGINAEIIEI